MSFQGITGGVSDLLSPRPFSRFQNTEKHLPLSQ